MTYDYFRPVCRRHNRDTEGFLHTIHFIQESRKHPLV